MTVYAGNIMVTDFDTVNEDAPIQQAISLILKGKVRKSGHKSVSLMVLDAFGQLTGVITMYDILYHLRPDFLNHGIDADVLPWAGRLKDAVDLLKTKTVKQVMSFHVVAADENEHIMVILDRMVKHKYRRLPIVKESKPVGIIYISDIYQHIFEQDAF